MPGFLLVIEIAWLYLGAAWPKLALAPLNPTLNSTQRLVVPYSRLLKFSGYLLFGIRNFSYGVAHWYLAFEDLPGAGITFITPHELVSLFSEAPHISYTTYRK
ncbi:hypothetical protein TNCV_1573361 [Trichonephila clavipes]|uniref:Uncharacterized protein n=1 Tax=Trichonephila clavipes TaxID=2585209 RepID=A0A8X6SQE1_TRICX|nr:hypothetical protein TNCV_1573361 [Trichonephila clavipes]